MQRLIGEAYQSNPDLIIENPNDAKKFSYRIKIKGKVNELNYQDPEL